MDTPSIQGSTSFRTDDFGQGGLKDLKLSEELGSILSGDGLTVLSPSDFEKLLALMDMENEEQKRKMFSACLGSAMAILAGRYESFSSVQKEAAGVALKAAEELSGAENEYLGACGQLEADAELLAAMNEELEAMLEAEATTPEERKENVDEAEKKAAEGAEEVKQEKTDETEQKEESPEIKAKREEIAAQEKKIAADQENVEKAKGKVDVAEKKAKETFQALEAVGLQYVTEAVILAAKDLCKSLDEQPDGVKKKEEINPMIQALSEYVDKIQEMQDEELREMVAKVVKCIVFIEKTDSTVPPTNFPEYEKRV